MADLTRRGLLAAGALTLLAGCGKDQPRQQAADGRPQGTVNVWLHGSQDTGRQFQELVHRYMAETQVDVRLLYLPVGQLDAKLLTAFSGGAPPDVFKIGHWSFPAHAKKNRLAPVDTKALPLRNYEPGTITPLTYQDVPYGVPIDFNPCLLYYRKDRFEEAGLDPAKPPSTWEEIAEYSAKLTTKDRRRVGLQWLYGDPQWALMMLTALIKGKGGSFPSLATEQGLNALTYMSKIGNPKLSNPLGALGLFYSGEAAMVVSGAFLGPALEKLGKDKLTFGKQYGVAPMPAWAGGTSVVPAYTWGWGVAKDSPNQFTAWHLVNYLQGAPSVTANLDNGIIIPAKGWREAGPRGKSEIMKIVADSLPHVDFGPIIPGTLELAKAAASAVDSVAHGKATPAQAAAAFDTTVRLIR
ncbi:extracellular solute-binding protein [Nonomuraea typhae]|uniref:extracellular solute-binding protein n=1 Tax=Nonomuraea typhae TaxID=2603600 RepID=UPI0012F9AE08|nr:extracellular solute-binding protein [Nonomuraea typhae]